MPAVTAAEASTANYEFMGPTLLAQQKVREPKMQANSPLWWDRLYQHLEARFGMLRNWRYSWWVYWRVLAEFFAPARYLWLVVANRMWRGSAINDAIIDSTGLQALRTCASGMWSGLTNPSRPWIKLDRLLTWQELDAAAKAWIEDTQKKLYTVLAQSNFYTEMAQAFLDLALIGTSPPIIYEDAEDVIRLYLPAAGEYYLACGSRLEVDVFNREFTFTVAEIVEFAGFDYCPQEIQKLYLDGGGSLDMEFVVCHSIEPNFEISKKGSRSGDPMRVLPPQFTWREVYWLKGKKSQKPLVIRGFHEKCFFPLRWSKVANEPYGRGPCMDALGDNKQVQTETRRKAEFLEKGIRPPMGADVELKNEPQSIMPAQVTYMNTAQGANTKKFWPLFEVSPGWMGPITEDIKTVNQRIQACLFVDVFMAITQMEGVQPRNELELTKRDLERLQQLGPVIELVEQQLALMIKRVLAIMSRRRVPDANGRMMPMLKPMPRSLAGVPLKIEFVNIMRIAQRSAEAVGIKDFMATIGEASGIAKNAGLPDPARIVKWDEAGRILADANNIPNHILFTDAEVLENDKARAKATQAAQAPEQAMAAVNAAKTLSETSMQPGNVLSALAGGGGAGAAPI